jgi:hypothetical protein
MYEVTKKVKMTDKLTVFDRWLYNQPNGDLPYIESNVGSGSDHTNFLQRAGLPCIDQRMIRSRDDPLNRYNAEAYPLYHTAYETFDLIQKFIDPDFKVQLFLFKSFPNKIFV